MTIMRHELRQGRTAFGIWTASIGFLLAVCIFLFPEMRGQMEDAGDLFASMGSFTAAFGMDRLSFGTLIGFYAIECGNVLGLGGAFYAAFRAVGILGREEQNRTAEFLLTHPVSRGRVLAEKLLAVLLQITAMNVLLFTLSACSIAAIKETVPWRDIALLHLAFYLLQLELAGICFGVSAYIRKGGPGIGLGIAAVMYFLNLISNIAESAKFLKYITPFAYCEGADLVANGRLDGARVAVGMAAGVLLAAAGCYHYAKKDIHG